MAVKNNGVSPQLKALKRTDLSPMIRMSGLMMPRMIDVFLQKLDPKEKKVIDEVMPVGGEKMFYVQLLGTPTPPIVVQMAQPLTLNVMAEDDVQKKALKGLKLTIDDIQAIQERKIVKVFWSLKGQFGTLLGLAGMFLPMIKLGPRGIKELQNKAMTHFKPLIDLMPH